MKFGNYLLLDASGKIIRVSLAFERAVDESQEQQWRDEFKRIKPVLSEKEPLVFTLWERDSFFGFGERHELDDEDVLSEFSGIIGTIEDISDFLRRRVMPAPFDRDRRFDSEGDLAPTVFDAAVPNPYAGAIIDADIDGEKA